MARYCAAAEHCEQEVCDKLAAAGVDESDRQSIIDYLTENAYLNPVRYCEAFVHDKVAYQGWGRRKIEAALKAKRLPTSALRKALDEMDQTAYSRQMEHLINRRKGEPKEKTIRFLLQRGYTMDEILSQTETRAGR